MHTQLYLNVLSRYHWIYHAQAMSHAYSDSGIFCIFGSAHPSRVSVDWCLLSIEQHHPLLHTEWFRFVCHCELPLLVFIFIF